MQLLAAPTRIIQFAATLLLWMIHVATVELPVMMLSFHVVEDVKQYHTGQQLLPQLPQLPKNHVDHHHHQLASHSMPK